MSRSVDERTRALVEPASKVILATASDPVADAAAERARASFDPEEVADFLSGRGRRKRRCVSSATVSATLGRRPNYERGPGEEGERGLAKESGKGGEDKREGEGWLPAGVGNVAPP